VLRARSQKAERFRTRDIILVLLRALARAAPSRIPEQLGAQGGKRVRSRTRLKLGHWCWQRICSALYEGDETSVWGPA
jgi:hypothetical protein